MFSWNEILDFQLEHLQITKLMNPNPAINVYDVANQFLGTAAHPPLSKGITTVLFLTSLRPLASSHRANPHTTLREACADTGLGKQPIAAQFSVSKQYFTSMFRRVMQ